MTKLTILMVDWL